MKRLAAAALFIALPMAIHGQSPKEAIARENFARAYERQVAAGREEDSARKDALLAESAEGYQKTLADFPSSPEALTNLALVKREQGSWSESIALLERAASARPDDAAEVLTTIGDIWREHDQPGKALESYEGASVINPTDDQPRLKLLTLLLTTDAKPDTIMTFARKQLADDFPQLAAAAYLRVIERTRDESPRTAEDALVRWVDIEANTRGFDEKSLEQLPAEWQPEAVKELRRVVENPTLEAVTASWWRDRSNHYRQHSIGSVVYSLASQVLERGDYKTATKIFDAARHISAEPISYQYDANHEQLEQRPIPYFNACVRLAELYANYPELDPTGSKFREMRDQIFHGKFQAYLDKDLLTIQRYHTVLGIILDDRKVYQDPNPYNAIFQLHNAILKANERFAAKPELYQPLPDLHVRLARASASIKSAAAPEYAIDAAESCLDADDLDTAAAMLELAGSPALPGLKKRVQLDQEILAARRNSKYDFGGAAAPTSFIARQRFKAFSDAAAQADAANALSLYLRALAMIEKERALASPLDVERLKRIRSAIIGVVTLRGSNTVQSARDLREAKQFAKVWTFGGGSSGLGTEIGWTSDVLVAANVASKLVPLAPNIRPAVTVDAGHVKIVGSDSAPLRNVVAMLQGGPGIATVDVVYK